MNRRDLLAGAAAVPLLPAAAANGANLPLSEAEATAASAKRLRAPLVCAVVLEITEAQIQPLDAVPDEELVHADALIDLCEEHGLSIDRLLFDDLEPMMRSLAARRTAHKRDSAVVAYRAWLDARKALRDCPGEDGDPEYGRLYAAEWHAKEVLATLPVHSFEGAAGKVYLMMVFAGHDNSSGADTLDPETFGESNWAHGGGPQLRPDAVP